MKTKPASILFFSLVLLFLVSELSGSDVRTYPSSEFSEAGVIAEGDCLSTHASDDKWEVLVEQDATIGPPPKRADLLQHTWEFLVPAAAGYLFHLEAYRVDAGDDGDNFSFSCSFDGGISWSTMGIVGNGPPDVFYDYSLPAGSGGSLLVRVVDTDRTAARKNHAYLYVDEMYVETSATPPPPPPPVSDGRIVGYYTSWSIYGREYYLLEHEPGVDHVPADRVTHISYAFANLEPDGTVVLGDEFADVNKIFGNEPPGASFKGNFQQLQILKSQYPHLKTLIAVGGWTWSDHFSDVFADPLARAHFCSSLLDFVVTFGFDGAEIDWEYPGDPGEGDNGYRPGGVDAANYVATLAECRPGFEAAGRLLTVASPCIPELYTSEMDLSGMAGYLDWFNLMGYDLHGAWDPVTGHHSQLYENPADPLGGSGLSQSACVEGHLALGVAAEKLNLGIPTYGRAYARVAESAAGEPPILGLFQTFSGVPKGTWDGGKWGVTGIFDYEDIVRNILPAASYAFDTSAGVPTLTWSLGRKQGMGFLSYEDPASICEKVGFVRGKSLGGLAFWEFSADAEDHPDSLVRAIYCSLNPGSDGCATCP